MNRAICFVNCSKPVNDDIRDALLTTAYLMIKEGWQKKRSVVKSDACEGQIRSTFESTALYGMSGFLFEGKIETPRGDVNVSYIVRPQDIPDAEEADYFAWGDSKGENLQQRPNPIRVAKRRVAHN